MVMNQCLFFLGYLSFKILLFGPPIAAIIIGAMLMKHGTHQPAVTNTTCIYTNPSYTNITSCDINNNNQTYCFPYYTLDCTAVSTDNQYSNIKLVQEIYSGTDFNNLLNLEKTCDSITKKTCYIVSNNNLTFTKPYQKFIRNNQYYGGGIALLVVGAVSWFWPIAYGLYYDKQAKIFGYFTSPIHIIPCLICYGIYKLYLAKVEQIIPNPNQQNIAMI